MKTSDVHDAGAANGRRRAVLRVRGTEGIPAERMLAAAERVREAAALLGIDEVSIEVVNEPDDGPGPFQTPA